VSNETDLQTVMTHTVVTVWTMWHIVVTIDVARGAGIRVVILGDVAMALGPQNIRLPLNSRVSLKLEQISLQD